MMMPNPTRNVTKNGVITGISSSLSIAKTRKISDAPKPIAAVITPARIRRKRLSSGDSRNFSNCGNTSSAIFSRSFADFI